jgi:putative ABC transport system permease protein
VRTARVRWKEQSIDLVATDLSHIAQRPYRFKQGRPEEIWPQLENSDTVVVSEPFAFHHLVEVGDSLLLATDLGERGYRILGIYYDYGSDAGTVMMSRATYERSFRDRGFTGLGLFTAAGVSAQALIGQIRNLAGPEQQLLIRSNRDLREISLRIFDRTFAITQVLRALSVSVAFIGVLTALMALQLERARELAVLRAIGLLPRELWKVVTYQTGLMGALAGLMSLPLGALLAYILVHAINKRSFGWTLQLSLAPGLLGQALLLAFGAAVLAGLYPAWRMARTNPADALREG